MDSIQIRWLDSDKIANYRRPKSVITFRQFSLVKRPRHCGSSRLTTVVVEIGFIQRKDLSKLQMFCETRS